MKKLLFASLVAAAGLVFGDGVATPVSSAGFEVFAHGTTGVSGYNDAGVENGDDRYFSYEEADSSTDGSTVKQFGGADALTEFVYNAACGVPDYFAEIDGNSKYLELSTEGGILWRSWYAGNGVIGGEYDVEGSTAYIDTLVQFTATEDGTDPTLVEDKDKLAIWLKVTNEGAATNLCVRAGFYDGSGVSVETYVLTNAPAINPGQWYRLTVQFIPEVGEDCSGFLIWIDGKQMATSTKCYDEEEVEIDDFEEEVQGQIEKGQLFLSALTEDMTLSAVGFKGSGAVDDLALTAEEPAFIGAGTSSVDFTISLDAGVSSVTYTIDGAATMITATTVVSAPAGATVTFVATAKEWYVIDAESLGDYTVVADGSKAITSEDAPTPAGSDTDVKDVKAWAKANGLSYKAIQDAGALGEASYLLGTDKILTAQPTLEIASIAEVEGGWQITVQAKAAAADADKTVSLANLRGTIKLFSADTLAGLAAAVAAPLTKGTDFTTDNDGVATVKIPSTAKNFMKASIGVAPAAE